MTTVNEYEIEVSFLAVKEGHVSRTYTQFAYSPSDALYQTSIAIFLDYADIRDFKIHRLGPPARLIELATNELRRTIEDQMARLSVKRKKD